MRNDETRATEGGVLDGKEFSTPPMRNPSFFESEAASTSPRIMEPRLGMCVRACPVFDRQLHAESCAGCKNPFNVQLRGG